MRRFIIFCALALLLWVGESWYGRYQARVVHCPPDEVLNARLAEALRQGGAPAKSQVLRLLKDEQILLREALLRGFHRFDPVILQRLEQDLAFLNFSDAQRQRLLDRDAGVNSALLDQLIQGDELIRRRLRHLLIAQLAYENSWHSLEGDRSAYRAVVKHLRKRYRDFCDA